MLEVLLIGGVGLIVINLVVRDQTQFRISRLRAETLALRSEEKRLSERRDEVELMVAQIADALMRADRRRLVLERGCATMQSIIDEIQAMLSSDEGTVAD